MKRLLTQLSVSAGVLLTAGCSTDVTDLFKAAANFVVLRAQTAIVLVSNSTTQNQPACFQGGNTVVIQRSIPEGGRVFCRDVSALSPELLAGRPFCDGGVDIQAIAAPNQVVECGQMTLCGRTPEASLTRIVGDRADGGQIEELTFTNLPWGCDVDLEYSADPTFSEDEVDTLAFYIQPPECPFCETQSRVTCDVCEELDPGERVISGQHVTCVGPNCANCTVLNNPSEIVLHGQGKLYYKRTTGDCITKCTAESLVRVCDNGLWRGDAAYTHPQCIDPICGCNLPNDPITYAHNSIKSIYKAESPACGVECADVRLNMTCNDGTWLTGNPGVAVTEAQFTQHPARNCTKRICHCPRTGRETVADGQSKTVFSKNLVTCQESCNQFDGVVTCSAGELQASDPAFLNFAHDSCVQEDCGCRVNLAGGEFILVNDGSNATIYQYDHNTPEVPDACTNPAYQVSVSCNDKVLSTYDSSKFKYKTCDNTPMDCSFLNSAGNRVSFDHNTTITVSKTASPACGQACENLTLKCENSVIKKAPSWANATAAELLPYNSASPCTPRNCDCDVNGHVVPFGQTIDGFYKVDKVTDCNLQGCEQAKAAITCGTTGATSSRGDAANLYRFRACEVIRCGCEVPWGGTVDDGRTIKVFSVNAATCAQRTLCEDTARFRLLTCSNGNITPSYDTTLFQYPACKPAVCECSFKGVRTPFGGTLKLFEFEEAPAGQTCQSISAEATCGEGGTWSGADMNRYNSIICNDLSDDGSGGGTGGGNGNDEGPGSGIKRRLGLGDGGPGGGGGGPCLSFAGCRSNTVTVSSPSFEKKGCVLPWGGGEVEFYATVTAFNRKCVSGGGKCSNHRITRTCHFPKWTGDDSYLYPSCEEQAVCP